MHVGNAILIVVRVGGRLVISNLLSSAKHPFILYQSISPYHIVRRIHPSFQFTRRSEGLGNQRCQVVRECTHCFHYKPLLMSQIMGNLPPDRLNGERQYQVSGVDFWRPFLTSYMKLHCRQPIYLLSAPDESLHNPADEDEDSKLRYLTSWQRVTFIKQHFWRSWRRDYIHSLQVRGKWTEPQSNIQVGQLVIVHEDNLPPQCWNLARVTGVILGRDQRPRALYAGKFTN